MKDDVINFVTFFGVCFADQERFFDNVILDLRWLWAFTAQKVKFSIKDFFSKCDQIRSFLRIFGHIYWSNP